MDKSATHLDNITVKKEPLWKSGFGECKQENTKSNTSESLRQSGDSLHKCDICKKQFLAESYLENHRLKKHNNPSAKTGFCTICKVSFLSGFSEHMEGHRVEKGAKQRIATQKSITPPTCKSDAIYKPHVCRHCRAQFAAPENYASHLKTHGEILELVECAVCKTKFVTQEEFNSHLNNCKIKQKAMKFKCYVCSETSNDVKFMQEHVLKHTQNLKASDPEVKKEHKELSEKLSAGNVHGSLDDIFRCKYCWKSFGGREWLKSHVEMTHMASRECYMCKKMFSTRSSLLTHISKFHNQNKKVKVNKLRCHKCSNTFSTKSLLRKHISIAHMHGELGHKHVCSICSQGVKSLRLLKLHMAEKHPGEKLVFTFVCHTCGKVGITQISPSWSQLVKSV